MADGTLSARYWSLAAKELEQGSGILYFHNGERPRHVDTPQFEGVGEIKLESSNRGSGYWTTRSENPHVNTRTSGVYVRADDEDLRTLDEGDDAARAALIASRLDRWRVLANG
jgi:hypothetical protein